ncbi:MAG: enoyl-CoA hydratase-related protein [Dehalococcoidia bacterium]
MMGAVRGGAPPGFTATSRTVKRGVVMAFEFLKSETVDGVLVLTMHDPATRNAIGPEMGREMEAEIDRFSADPDLRVLVITGTDPGVLLRTANVRGFQRAIDATRGAGRTRADRLGAARPRATA